MAQPASDADQAPVSALGQARYFERAPGTSGLPLTRDASLPRSERQPDIPVAVRWIVKSVRDHGFLPCYRPICWTARAIYQSIRVGLSAMFP